VFEDSSSASWYNLYKQAMLEIAPQALLGRVQLAQAAVRARLDEIAAVSARSPARGRMHCETSTLSSGNVSGRSRPINSRRHLMWCSPTHNASG